MMSTDGQCFKIQKVSKTFGTDFFFLVCTFYLSTLRSQVDLNKWVGRHFHYIGLFLPAHFML